MAGYGMRDGSAIVRAIGDYANYRQRQSKSNMLATNKTMRTASMSVV